MPRGNPHKLIPTNKRSKEEASELGRKGGIASGIVRKEKATLKLRMQAALELKRDRPQFEVDGKIDNADAICLALIEEAAKGNPTAYNAIRDIIGEKPVDKVEAQISGKIMERMDEINKQLFGSNKKQSNSHRTCNRV